MNKDERRGKFTCVHFNGAQKCCNAGVEYNSVTPNPKNMAGYCFRQPCFPLEHWEGVQRDKAERCERGTCDKFRLPDPAEIEAKEAARIEFLRRVDIVTPFVNGIKKDCKGGDDFEGKFNCPACHAKDALMIRVASFNNHAHVFCSSENCVQYRE